MDIEFIVKLCTRKRFHKITTTWLGFIRYTQSAIFSILLSFFISPSVPTVIVDDNNC